MFKPFTLVVGRRVSHFHFIIQQAFKSSSEASCSNTFFHPINLAKHSSLFLQRKRVPIKTNNMPPHVLIIGGGIGGLCLAHGFKKHGISFHVYERDHSDAFRAQGYRIRLAGHAIKALEYLLDPPTWETFELSCAQMRLSSIPEIDAATARVDESSKRGKPGGPPDPRQNPERFGNPHTVDRTVFRQLLLRGLGEENLTYGRAFEKYEETSSGVRAYFTDGSSAEGTLLVAADGNRSAVRKQFYPQLEILDTGGRCVYGKTPITQDLVSQIDPVVMKGMSAVKDRSREELMSLIIEPIIFPNRTEMEKAGIACPHDYLYWVLVSMPNAMGFAEDEHVHMGLEESEQRVLQVTSHWHPTLRSIFENQQKGETSCLMIDSVKPDFGTWDANEHVTAIGDAIHLMGPTAGSGAITALRDAQHLCQLLIDEGQSKDTIEKYEMLMRKYAGETIELSWMAAKHIFGMKSENERHIGEVMSEVREKRGM